MNKETSILTIKQPKQITWDPNNKFIVETKKEKEKKGKTSECQSGMIYTCRFWTQIRTRNKKYTKESGWRNLEISSYERI